MELGKFPVPGRPTILITVRKGPTTLAVGAGGGCFGHFYSHIFFSFSPVSPFLLETVRYRPKYCLKEPLNPKQPTNHLIFLIFSSTVAYLSPTSRCLTVGIPGCTDPVLRCY